MVPLYVSDHFNVVIIPKTINWTDLTKPSFGSFPPVPLAEPSHAPLICISIARSTRKMDSLQRRDKACPADQQPGCGDILVAAANS